MKFKLDTTIPEYSPKISHKDKILFFGSCFSDEISRKFQNAGFNTSSNPCGIIFHPLPMAHIFQNILFKNLFETKLHTFEKNKLHFSWNHSPSIYGTSKKKLLDKIASIENIFFKDIQTATYLFITFGTAWGYLHKNEKFIVANCHKQADDLFQKELTEINKMRKNWIEVLSKIYEINSSIQIVFTVSPVRHIKNGLAENNRSKARLFELISILESQFPTRYFPSYEILIDELRDYRFYKEDLIHPNEQALHYIWSKIKTAFFDFKTLKIIDEIEKLRKLDQHLILSKDTKERTFFEKQKKEKIALFLKKYPELKW